MFYALKRKSNGKFMYVCKNVEFDCTDEYFGDSFEFEEYGNALWVSESYKVALEASKKSEYGASDMWKFSSSDEPYNPYDDLEVVPLLV